MINSKSIGQKFLVTTDNWFTAPDGQNYKSVFGTVEGIHTDKDALGIQTNRHSTNWYLEIGNMIIAGCQIHYALRTDECSKDPYISESTHEGYLVASEGMTRIYFAD